MAKSRDDAELGLAFDWDGTAVPDRLADASPIRSLLEALLRKGIYVAVITGTNFRNVDRQFSADLRTAAKRRLYVAANRGSEVFGFDGRGRPVLVSARVATPQEEQLLTATFASVGLESNRVPPRVIHLGGGPEMFARLVEEQIRQHTQINQERSWGHRWTCSYRPRRKTGSSSSAASTRSVSTRLSRSSLSPMAGSAPADR